MAGKLIMVDVDGLPSYRFATADGWTAPLQWLGRGEAEFEDKIQAALSATL